MGIRGNRRALVPLVVVLSMVVVAAIGTTAFLVTRSQQRSDDVAEASGVAAAFAIEAAQFRSSVQRSLAGATVRDPAQVKEELEAALEDVPELGDAPAWGRKHSEAYAQARTIEQSLTDPYDDVPSALDEAVVGQRFIKAARAALAVKLDRFVPGGALPDGEPIRTRLIPGFERVLATFDEVEVPQGQESLARQVRGALTAVLADAKKAAKDLDSGRSTSINARAEYASAGSAVLTYETTLRMRLTSAMQKAGVAVSLRSSASAT